MCDLHEILRSFKAISEPVYIEGHPYVFSFDRPASPAEVAVAEAYAVIPSELVELWSFCRGAELYRDPVYGQWGLRVLPPPAAVEMTIGDRRHHREIAPGELAFGEFLGDGERLMLTREGQVMIALEIDPRPDWPVVGASICEFLARYREHEGSKFW